MEERIRPNVIINRLVPVGKKYITTATTMTIPNE
jgi:hypothetical protein